MTVAPSIKILLNQCTNQSKNCQHIAFLSPITDEQQLKRPKTFRKSYIGDYKTEAVALSPSKATNFIEVAQNRLADTRKKLRLERQKCRRLLKKVTTAEALLSELKEKQLITESTSDILQVRQCFYFFI